MKKKYLIVLVFIFAATALISCNKYTSDTNDNFDSVESNTTKSNKVNYENILVFIPGSIAGSAPYENLYNGAIEYASENGHINVKSYEAGFNQAEWESQLKSLVASGTYDIVLTSNPSLPEICDNISKKFPNQKFIITDAYLEGNENIKTYEFNQYQQSVILGHLAGLITTSNMANVNSDKIVGFILSQEYPMIKDNIIPGFKAGLNQVDKDIALDIRVIGNWYDASKASELALSMIDNGVDSFTSIAGGAAEGLYKVASEKGLYVVAYDTNSYQLAPKTIVGSGNIKSTKLVKEALKEATKGELTWGVAERVGIEEGYIDFFTEDPLFKQSLSDDVYSSFMDWYKMVKNGTIIIKKNN
jgi:simple sugar transport system substrate-binding protein